VPSIVPESESLHVIMREGPLCFIVFGLSYRKIVDQEESFLRNTFGEEFGPLLRSSAAVAAPAEECHSGTHVWVQLSSQRIRYDIRYHRRRVIS
jgi:hypothetical protein